MFLKALFSVVCFHPLQYFHLLAFPKPPPLRKYSRVSHYWS